MGFNSPDNGYHNWEKCANPKMHKPECQCGSGKCTYCRLSNASPFCEPCYKKYVQGNRLTKGSLDSKQTLRYNEGKPRLSLIPSEWILWLGELLTIGAKKYAPDNWKVSLNTEDHDSLITDRMDSLLRHYASLKSGELKDPETGCYHGVCIAWNALVITWYHHYKGN